jgi:hypothetical protein
LKNAAAEKILSHDGDWTVYSDGRAAAFVSYVRGDSFPNSAVDASGSLAHDVKGGGMLADASLSATAATATGTLSQGTVERVRVRSGMIGNTFGFGVRGPATPYTTVKGYVQIWAWVESLAQEKNQINTADVRQGYVKAEGLWGSLLVGRSRGLYSRGATDIDVLYGHGFGVGFPGLVDSNGPTQGHIGFGVLGSGFASQVTYATPVLGGLQLSIGAFDPVHLQGAWSRTKWPRAEAEMTFERHIAEMGKVVLFGNGAYQNVYKSLRPDSEGTAAKGFGYGGRLELGPVRLGVAGHYGYGLGLNYALEVSDASVDPETHLRKFAGYYVQSMVVLGRVDVSAGWGLTQVILNPSDNTPDPITGNIPHSVIKSQQGISCGAVYHVRPWLHVDLDLFRANFKWSLGEKQVAYIANSGMIFTW